MSRSSNFLNRQSLSLLLFLVMLAGLLLSRALLSISIGLWLVFILNDKKLKTGILENKWLVIWSFLPLVFFAFGMYQDVANAGTYDYLLTLTAYPIAAAATITVTENLKEKWMKLWIATALISLVYPFAWYFLNFNETNLAYGKGGSLPTLMDKDHVRFGLFLNAALLFTATVQKIKEKARIAIMVVFALAILIMAVRTAWMSMMIIAIVSLCYNFGRMKGLALVLLPLLVTCFLIFPSIKQKINYTVYDYTHAPKDTYNADFSDGARRTVNAVAWKSITGEKGVNVGWAAIPQKLRETFKEDFPGQHLNYGVPFNQWLYWLMGGGWPAAVFFSLWLLAPAYHSIKTSKWPLLALTLVITASCMVESTLVFQYGVFLHAWAVSIFWAHGKRNKLAGRK